MAGRDPGALRLNVGALISGTTMVGPGVRDGVWVQGCSIRCPGCANRAYQPHEERVRLSVARLAGHLAARRHRIDGLSVLGGEPTEQPRAVAALLAAARALGLSTVLFSGRLLEEIEADPCCRELLAHTDLLVDGPFVQGLADPGLHWRGSSNQRLIRLGDRFSARDLEPGGPSGEVIVGRQGMILHGVGAASTPTCRPPGPRGRREHGRLPGRGGP